MSEINTKTYRGKHINVTFESKRCSHGGDCIKSLPSVFNLKARPWINLQDCDLNKLAETINQCPSGALSFSEASDETVSLKVTANGPLNIRGQLTLKENFKDTGSIHSKVSLCRCGLSKNMPYCDASHLKEFKANGNFDKRPAAVTKQAPANNLNIICVENGPLMCQGNVEMHSADGETITVIDPALCRCGASMRKPFCDGTHNKIKFKT